MSPSTQDLQKALEHLETEQRGRAFGLVGAAAAAVGEWLAWITRSRSGRR